MPRHIKRIYSEDGKRSAPAWIVKTMYVLAVPIIIPWTFFAAIWCEMCSAHRYAIYRVREELDSLRRLWRSAR